MNEVMQAFAQAVTDRSPQYEIIAYFPGGREGVYTMRIFELLKDEAETIVDAQTGEVIFCR